MLLFKMYFLRSLLIYLLRVFLIGLSSWIYYIYPSFLLLPIYILVALVIVYLGPSFLKSFLGAKAYRGEFRDRLLSFSHDQGITLKEIYVKKGGAYQGLAIGIFNNKSVVFSDQLLKSHSYDQIEAVFAHELGYHVNHYVSIHACLFAVITFFSAGFIVAALDLIVPHPAIFLLVVSFLAFLLALFLSRNGESQADRFAKMHLYNPLVFARFLEGSVAQSQKEGIVVPKDPWYKIFYTHPWVYQRIAFFEAEA